MRLFEIMSTPVVTPARTGIAEAATILVTAYKGALIGIVSEADVLKDRKAPDPRVHGRHIRA